MPLQQAFALTPRESRSYAGSGNWAGMHVFGVTNFHKPHLTYRYSFDHQHTSDELCLYHAAAGNAAADYFIWNERRHVPHIQLYYNLSAFESHKEVALTFRFDAVSESRVLIYTDAGLLDEEILHVGDDQFLIEVESTDAINLYFIHANLDGSTYGGYWFFRGIDGYIA